METPDVPHILMMDPGPEPATNRFSNYLSLALVLAAVLFAGYSAAWAWANIRADHPLEYRENAVLLTADLLAQGANPYALEHRPVQVNGFGIGYFWITYPFVRVFGGTFLTLRLVSLGFAAAACGLLAWVMRVDRVSWRWALVAALLLLAQLGQGMSIVARPDGVGLFLFLASLVIPYGGRFRPGSLALGAGLAILAGLTKAYFFLGLPLVFLHLLFFEDKLKGVTFGLLSGAALVLALWGIDALYECYFLETIFGVSGTVTRSWPHLFRIGGQYVRDNFGLFLLAGAGLVLWGRWGISRLKGSGERPAPRGLIDLERLRTPLLQVPGSFPAVILGVNAAVIILLLGLHPGNDVLYYHQLISPFLLWSALKLVESRFHGHALASGMVLLTVACQGTQSAPFPKDHAAEWRRLESLIGAHTNVFAAPHLAHLLWRQGRTVYDTGQTECSLNVRRPNPSRVAAEYQARADSYVRKLAARAYQQQFDLVLICRDLSPLLPAAFLNKGYISKGLLPAPMTFDYWIRPYPLEMWVPSGPPASPPQQPMR